MSKGNLQQTKAKQGQTVSTGAQHTVYDEQERTSWDITENYHKTSSIFTAKGVQFEELNDKDIYQLRDELFLDKHSKSESFDRTYQAVNNLLNMSVTKGRYFDENGNGLTADFFSTFFDAKQSVYRYISDHSRRRRLSTNGDRRLQIMLRIRNIMGMMEKDITKVHNALPEERQRMIEYARDGVREEDIPKLEEAREIKERTGELLNIISGGLYGGMSPDDEKVKKAQKTWLIKDYTEQLKELISGGSFGSEEERDDFIAFLENENNRLVANSRTISILAEAAKPQTLGIPWMEEALRRHIAESVSKEDMLLPTLKFADKVQEAILSYGEANKVLAARVQKRRDRFLKELHVPADAARLYDHPKMKQMLAESDDDEFEEQMGSLKLKVTETDHLIKQMLEKKYSVATRSSIGKRIVKHLGVLRVFGTVDQILDQCDFCTGMLQYLDPEAYTVEMFIERIMTDNGIEKRRRDHFVETVTGKSSNVLQYFDQNEWDKKAKKYARLAAANNKEFLKIADRKGRLLSKKQWDALEKLNLEGGAKDTDTFSGLLTIIMRETTEEVKISRREYLTERSYEDAGRLPALLKRVKHEKALIEGMEGTKEERFLSALMRDEAVLMPYKEMDAIYKGTEARYKKRKSVAEEQAEERTLHVKKLLQDHGMTADARDACVKRFRNYIYGIENVGEDTLEDEKVRTERINLERYGVSDWDAFMDRLEQYADSLAKGEEPEDFAGAKELYEKRQDRLLHYRDGIYKELLPILTDIPDVYTAMMLKEDSLFEDFLKDTLDVRLAPLMEGIKNETSVPLPVREQYVYSYVKSIYAGTLTGDAAFFTKQIQDYSSRVFTMPKEGGHSIEANIAACEKVLDKELKRVKAKKGESIALKIGVMAEINALTEKTETFGRLYDRKALESFAIEKLEEIRSRELSDAKKTDIEDKITREYKDESYISEADKKALEEIREKKEKGLEARKKYLGIDSNATDGIRRGKSLVRVMAKGHRSIDLDSKLHEYMRGMIERYCSDLNLPPVLTDALVEEGSSSDPGEQMDGIHGDSGLLYKHAYALAKMYELLRKQGKADDPMTDEEAQMFIVKCYGNYSIRKEILKDGGPDVSFIRKTEEYKAFRENYKKLKSLEELTISEPSVERERLELVSSLRVLLVTGVGLLDDSGKSIDVTALNDDAYRDYLKKIGQTIEKSAAYIKYSSQVSSALRKKLTDGSGDNRNSAIYTDGQVRDLREYFMDELMAGLTGGEECKDESWGARLDELKQHRFKYTHVDLEQGSIDNRTYAARLDKVIGSDISEQDLAQVIKDNTYIFKGKVNKYESLDDDQKKLFALGLMLMDKGAVGMGAVGTASLIAPGTKGMQDTAVIEEEIKRYVAGGSLNVSVNYKEALYKLNNYGAHGILNLNGDTLSVSAYDKAMQFVRAVSAKRASYGNTDNARLKDGYASIHAAFTGYGRKQQQEADSMRDEPLTVESVKDRLLEYASGDMISEDKISKELMKRSYSPLASAKYADKTHAHNKRMKGIQSRLSSMSEHDLKVFIRLMQDRTVIDTSMTDAGDKGPLYVDHKKRIALSEALSGDVATRSEVLLGFDDNESCHKALVNALSFKLRDDRLKEGKTIDRSCFEDKSFNRKTLVDWQLIEDTFKLMDEIKERQTSSYVLSHAKDYIDRSGNEKAIAEHNKLMEKYGKKKRDFSRQDFETYIKEQAKKDGGDDIARAVGGYHALTDKEKNLFFKVLSRRDLLDISRKNYYSSFFGKGERDFVNMADRSKLIDQYIDAGLEDNIGIMPEEGACYDAMESLFTTQISDRTEFSKNSDINGMFAVERYFFMGRGTAIDWKLFKRALNFVNRATEELEYVEGNAQLYRGAGELSKNGHMMMDYSFLRRNFHRTGNHWARRAGKTGLQLINEETGIVDTLDKIVDNINMVSDMLEFAGVEKEGTMMTGITWLKKNVSGNADKYKDLAKGEMPYKVGMLKVAEPEKSEEDEEKEKQAEKERREKLLFYDHVKEGIDNIMSQAGSVKEAAESVGTYLKDNFAASSEIIAKLSGSIGEQPEEDEDNLVVKLTKDTKADDSYGDIRDDLVAGKKKYEEVAGGVGNIKKSISQTAPGKEFVELVEHAVETGIYKLLNKAVIGNDVKLETGEKDKDGNEIVKSEYEAYKENAEKYAKDLFETIIIKATGKDDAATLVEYETMYYSVKKSIDDKIAAVTKSINYVKKCADHVKNVAECADNIKVLEAAKKNSKKRREEDEKRLGKAEASRLNEAQAEKVRNIVDKHRGLGNMAGEIAENMQYLNISEDVMNLTIDTVTIAGGKLNAGQEAIAKAIKAGIEFALYAIRVATDRDALNTYFMKTKAGQRIVNKLKAGFRESGNAKLTDELNEQEQLQQENGSGWVDVVDMISDARGYEHTSELVENTGMSMAQSIAFSASNYNPMIETKMMAVTVMCVMGLHKEIGDTEPKTVEKLFNSFSMAR